MLLEENETIPVDLRELAGVNVWLLQNFSAAANITVTVDVLRLPDSIRNSPDRVKQLDYVFNQLQGAGYDCALPSTISSFDRSPIMKFIMPNQPYGAPPRPACSSARLLLSRPRPEPSRRAQRPAERPLGPRPSALPAPPHRLPGRLPGPAAHPLHPAPAALLLDPPLQRAPLDHPLLRPLRRRRRHGVGGAQEEPQGLLHGPQEPLEVRHSQLLVRGLICVINI